MTPEDLTDAERDVLLMIEAEGGCLLGSQRDDPGIHSSPASWVSGAFITQLITQPGSLLEALPASLILGGLRMRDAVDLRQSAAPAPVMFYDCWFDEPLFGNGFDGRDLNFQRCRLRALDLSETQIDGGINLLDCVVEEWINLFGTSANGGLLLSNCSVGRRNRIAINAYGSTFENGVMIRGTHLDGTARFTLSDVTGSFSVRESTIVASPMVAIDLIDATIDRNVNLTSNTLAGSVDLERCKVSHALEFADTHVSADQVSVLGRSLTTGGDVTFAAGSVAYGGMDFVSAHVGGSFDLRDTSIIAPRSIALAATNALLEADFRVNEQTRLSGSLLLARSEIRGSLLVDGATLFAPLPDAPILSLNGARVGRGVLFSSMEANGAIDANGMRTSQNLQVSGCSIANTSEPAVSVDNAYVEGNVLVVDGTTISGGLTISGATIDGQMVLMESRLTARRLPALEVRDTTVSRTILLQDGLRVKGAIAFTRAKAGPAFAVVNCDLSEVPAFDLSSVTVNGNLTLEPQNPAKHVDLRRAVVNQYDEPRAAWATKYLLDGFTYRRHLVDAEATDPRTLLSWLSRSIGFSSQPYEAAALALEGDGHREHARYVLMEKARIGGKQGSRFGRALSFFTWALAGGGYRPRRALGWFILSLVVATILFAIVPADDLRATRGAESNPTFSSIGYAADVLLPIIDLKQTDSWTAKGVAMPLFWLFTLWGWILTTAIAATVTRLVSRE